MITVADVPAPMGRVDRVDRVGVFASVLCAIHCAAAPVLLLAAPAFGEIWAHPASHWMVALLVVPLAIFSLRQGWRLTPRWVKAAGCLGVLAILVGAVLPYMEAAAPATGGCADTCCPSLSSDAEGGTVLTIPPASVVTTLGGLFLITAHLGNLHACRRCRRGCCVPATASA